MPYRIEIATAAERQILKLEASVRRRIFKKLDALAINPRPVGVEKLTAVDAYRVRVGDYRIIYDIEDEATTVVVHKVGDRKDVYTRRAQRGYGRYAAKQTTPPFLIPAGSNSPPPSRQGISPCWTPAALTRRIVTNS